MANSSCFLGTSDLTWFVFPGKTLDLRAIKPNTPEGILYFRSKETQLKSAISSTAIQTDVCTVRDAKYQGLVLDPSTYHQDQIHVYHVAKEFGPATMGGLGMVVTALAVAQQKEGQTVNVVLPYYSFLKDQEGIDIQYHTTLSLDIRDELRGFQQVRFVVHSFQYSEAYDEHALAPVTVWLIGPGDVGPFDKAFDVKDAREIYFKPKAIPSEWNDLFFCKAAATFLRSQNVRSLGIGLSTAYPVDVIHLHGATNALVMHYLQQTHRSRHNIEKQPALIYTLHDYFAEFMYSNKEESINKFVDGIHFGNGTTDSSSHRADISKYYHNGLLFTSSLGIDSAHASTFVSKTMARDIVEGRLDFHQKELVFDSILDQAKKNLFIGITNGIDIRRLNPWTNLQLCQDRLTFPSVAHNDYATKLASGDEGACNGTLASNALPNPTVRSAKEAAKRHLISQGFLAEEDVHRPLVLFIGRFQYNKGLEFFATASSAINDGNGKFVIMGQPNDYPIEAVNELRSQFNGTVEVISDTQGQHNWGIYLRAAADFLLVPSLTESFGLVAAEGLLFGSIVITSGVGGLPEFLAEKPLDSSARQQNQLERSSLPERPPTNMQKYQYNSYFFDPFASDAHAQLSEVIENALRDWRGFKLNPMQHEAFLIKLLESALAMSWDRRGGPVAEYRELYKIALSLSRSPHISS
ncbi:hypothetical protein BGZ72_009825 [Mortierella alpina]|nr:hypothetical protein BGZ72_009825 [Mortierella alpina]